MKYAEVPTHLHLYLFWVSFNSHLGNKIEGLFGNFNSDVDNKIEACLSDFQKLEFVRAIQYPE